MAESQEENDLKGPWPEPLIKPLAPWVPCPLVFYYPSHTCFHLISSGGVKKSLYLLKNFVKFQLNGLGWFSFLNAKLLKQRYQKQTCL